MSAGANYYKKSTIVSYLTIALNIVSSLLYTPWMLSVIGKSDYGLYTLAASVINMFLIDFGFSSAVTRFVSKYNAEGDQEKIDNFLGMLYKLYGIIVGIVFVILFVVYFFIDQIYVALTPAEIEKFKVVYIISGSYSVLSFPFHTTFNGILNSYEKYFQMKICDLVHKILTVGLIIVALVCGLGLYSLVMVNALTGTLTLLAKWIILKRTTKLKINLKYFDKSLLKEIFGFSMWVTVSAICSRLIFNITPNVLAITIGAVAISYFSLASTIEGYTYTFASAIDGMFMPKIARLVKKDPSCTNVQPLLDKVGRIQYYIISLIFWGFVLVGKDFIKLWLGSGYDVVYYCAILLMLPAPFHLSQQIAKSTVVVSGKVKAQAFVNIAKAVVNLVLVVVFSYFWGVIGACVSICISYFVRNIGMCIIYHKMINLNMFKFHFNCYIKTLPGLIVAIIGGLLVNWFMPDMGWISFILKVASFTLIFGISMFLLSFNKYERELSLGSAKKVFRKLTHN